MTQLEQIKPDFYYLDLQKYLLREIFEILEKYPELDEVRF